MEYLSVCITLLICVIYADGVRLFDKFYQQKLVVNNATTYPVKGVLDCEALCLELSDSCQAVNVIYSEGHYFCEVFTMASVDLSESRRISNPKGKLIIKRGR